MLRIGTTGTQQGATLAQVRAARGLLLELADADPVDDLILHHGDCIGWDAQAHALARRIGCAVEMHPPLNTSKRAWSEMLPNEHTHPAGEYLARNRCIVDWTRALVACPKEETGEEMRSGTWATVRYARKLKRPIYIVRPSGRIERGDAAQKVLL